MNAEASDSMFASVAEAREDSFSDIVTILDERERQRLLLEWNDTAADFPRTRCIHELFAEQAEHRPMAVAVVIDDQHISYGALDSRANQLANYLRTLGVGPEVVVGVGIDRSPAMILAVLGILKAGGIYLPLDKNHPQERISYLLKDAGAQVVLVSAETESVFAPCGVQTLRFDPESAAIAGQSRSAPVSGAGADSLAYVMYTSGSSGQPKGVGVAHRNISRLVLNTNYVRISPRDVFLQLAPVTFDAATFEIWGALLNGAELRLYPSEQILDLLNLKRVIREAEVSILWLTAGLFNSIVDADVSILAPVCQLLVGGDVVSAAHVRRLLDGIRGCRVINGYGPTEGTTFSVCFPVPDASVIETTVPIGRAVSNTTLYVLGPDLDLVPIGATGELYIGGAGLARGYFHRPDSTAESFVPSPFGDYGSRLYKTGDMVRYSGDAALEFVGRVDFQAKVRGYRIELEEVEAALLADPVVRQAAVVAEPEARGDKRLVAYVVPAGQGEPDLRKLREGLGRRLPEYMVPSVFVTLDALPLTPNGKVDRRALPSLERHVIRAAPASGVEQTIVEIWKSALGVSEVGTEDDFFDLGGTSLAMINAVVEVGKQLKIPLDTSIVAGGATVKALAQAVRERMAAAGQQGPPVEQTIVEIWKSALGVSEVGTEDDFFDLGGTSLAMINAVVEVGKQLKIPLDTSIVAGGATVKALAQAVRERMPVHQIPPH